MEDLFGVDYLSTRCFGIGIMRLGLGILDGWDWYGACRLWMVWLDQGLEPYICDDELIYLTKLLTQNLFLVVSS
jgi:hypothetical protein